MGPDGAGARPPGVVDLVCGGIPGTGGEKKELKEMLPIPRGRFPDGSKAEMLLELADYFRIVRRHLM